MKRNSMRKLIDFIFPYNGIVIDRAQKIVYYRTSRWFHRPYDLKLASYTGIGEIRDINDIRGTLLINNKIDEL
jgi:hypothetical protein